MKLYSYYQSSASYRVRIALNLKGVPYDMSYVNLLKGEQKSADYAAINPQRIVPSLALHGRSLTQSLAIIEYLEETYPTPALLPPDPFARAHARALALAVACEIAPIGNLKVRKYLEDRNGFDKHAIIDWMQHWMTEGFTALETMVVHSPYTGAYCVGDTPGIVDCCLMPQWFNAERWRVDVTPYPTLSRIAAACAKHPAFIAAHPDNQKDKPE